MRDLREALADYAHASWSGWMEYLVSKLQFGPQRGLHGDGELEIWLPNGLRYRWGRQMKTLYAELPENEKESDREEADKILALVRESYLNEVEPEALGRCTDRIPEASLVNEVCIRLRDGEIDDIGRALIHQYMHTRLGEKEAPWKEEAEKKENRLVTVCSECKQASCWQGEFYCDDYKNAGTIELPISELRKLGYENEHYWEKEE